MVGRREYPRLRKGLRDSAEYQKVMRRMRRDGIPKDLADKAAVPHCRPRAVLQDIGGGE